MRQLACYLHRHHASTAGDTFCLPCCPVVCTMYILRPTCPIAAADRRLTPCHLNFRLCACAGVLLYSATTWIMLAARLAATWGRLPSCVMPAHACHLVILHEPLPCCMRWHSLILKLLHALKEGFIVIFLQTACCACQSLQLPDARLPGGDYSVGHNFGSLCCSGDTVPRSRIRPGRTPFAVAASRLI